jgi:hypothetical protein
MNILHIYKDYHPVLGGIENHIKVLAEAQAAAGHPVVGLHEGAVDDVLPDLPAVLADSFQRAPQAVAVELVRRHVQGVAQHVRATQSTTQ